MFLVKHLKNQIIPEVNSFAVYDTKLNCLNKNIPIEFQLGTIYDITNEST